MAVKVECASAESRGARARQEDCHAVFPVEEKDSGCGSGLLTVLADGMGGHTGGERASHVAVAAFKMGFLDGTEPLPERLRGALDHANARIARETEIHPDLHGMGCTLVGAWVTPWRLFWVSVGDSHVYLYRQGVTNKLNADHSLDSLLRAAVRDGKLSMREAQGLYRSNAVLSALTGQTLDLVDLPSSPTILDPEDILLLATDGLNTLSRDALTHEIRSYVEETPDAPLESLATTLIRAVESKNAPHQDNVTVVVIRIWDEGEGEDLESGALSKA